MSIVQFLLTDEVSVNLQDYDFDKTTEKTHHYFSTDDFHMFKGLVMHIGKIFPQHWSSLRLDGQVFLVQ